jgi:hypothetical protein
MSKHGQFSETSAGVVLQLCTDAVGAITQKAVALERELAA